MTRDVYGCNAEIYRIITTASSRIGNTVVPPIERCAYHRLWIDRIAEMKSAVWE